MLLVIENVAIGYSALETYNPSSNEDSYNVAIGFAALEADTTGKNNTAVGGNSLLLNTTGGDNTAVGTGSLTFNQTASNGTAVGYLALNANTTGTRNTAVGSLAGDANTDGDDGTFIGYAAGGSNTTGEDNIAVGGFSLDANTTGSFNTAVGRSSLSGNTTASSNTAVGYFALLGNTTGADHTVVGASAGRAVTTGSGNTFLGKYAGYATTTGHSNVFIGYRTNGAFGAGHLVTTGSKNTILGGYSGNQNGLDIRTTSNDIVLSDGDGFPRAHFDGAETWNFSCGASNALTEDRVSIDKTAMYTFPDAGTTLGYAAYRWGQIYSSVGSISTSDARDKTSVTALTADEIQASKLLAKEIGTYQWLASIEEKGADNARHHVGITVQRAIEIMESCNLDPMRYGFICYDAWEKDDLPLLEAGDRYGFRYEQLNQFLAAGFNARLEALES